MEREQRVRVLDAILRQMWPHWLPRQVQDLAVAIDTGAFPGVRLAMEGQFAPMQTTTAQAAMERALAASPDQMGAAAVEGANAPPARTLACCVCGARPARALVSLDAAWSGAALCDAHWRAALEGD